MNRGEKPGTVGLLVGLACVLSGTVLLVLLNRDVIMPHLHASMIVSGVFTIFGAWLLRKGLKKRKLPTTDEPDKSNIWLGIGFITAGVSTFVIAFFA